MTRNLLIFTCLTFVGACADSPARLTGLDRGSPALPLTPSERVQLRGIIELAPNESRIWLKTETGRTVLIGAGANLLGRLDGAEVAAVGTFDVVGGMHVEEFEVLAVNGRTVRDGTVERVDGVLYLKTAGGSAHAILDVPVGLEQHIGARIWFAPADEGQPAKFGLIS